jgi:excisionase family DNA binding protein
VSSAQPPNRGATEHLHPDDRDLLRRVADSCTLLLAEFCEMRQDGRQFVVSPDAATPSAGALGDAMTPKEATEYLRLSSVRALYAAVRKGQVPVHRLGPRRMRFLKAELDAVLARR